MIFKILEVDKDANLNIAVKVVYVEGTEEIKKNFIFDKKKTKIEIMAEIDLASPEVTISAEEEEAIIAERAVTDATIAGLSSEKDKDIIVKEKEVK